MLVPRSLAAMASHADDSGASRFALAGIRLERDRDGQPHAVATDGRRLLHATWREPEEAYPAGNPKPRAGFETILPCRLLADICKAGRKSSAPYLLVEETTANGTVRIVSADDGRTTVDELKPIGGRFPEWRDLVPSQALPIERYAARVKIPSRQLIEAADALGKLAADGGGFVTLEIRGEASPLILRAESDTLRATSVLMPVALDCRS